MVLSLPPRAGVFTVESSVLNTTPSNNLYSCVYYLGSSSLGDDYTGKAISIGSMDDFTNLFGSSSAINLNSIQGYLNQTERGLFFVKVVPAPTADVTISTVAAGSFILNVGGQEITVIVPASPVPTAESIIRLIVAALNNNVNINQLVEAEFYLNNSGVADFTASKFRIRSKNGQIFTLTKTGTNLSVTDVTVPASLNYWDYLSALDRINQEMIESPKGFIICPEAFFNLVNQFERTVVANKMESICRSLRWSSAIDSGNPSIVNSPIAAKVDAVGHTATLGHSAYYYPYFIDDDLDYVAHSALVCAYAMQLYQNVGIQEPPAGTLYPYNGISGVEYKLTNAQKDDLAQNRINVGIYKNGIGYVTYDTLTRSIDPRFKMISTRVILNCIESTIQDTVDQSNVTFRSIGSRGLFFLILKAIIENAVSPFYLTALYGATPEAAYQVRCTAEMQNESDLEAGIVNSEIFLVPAATARQIRNTVYPIRINGIPDALALLGA